MKKITYLVALFFVAQTTLFAQTAVSADFETWLIANNYDVIVNNLIDDDNAVAITTETNMFISSSTIADFTGIGVFVALENLTIEYNANVVGLDLSANAALTSVDLEACSNLTSLNVNGLTSLAVLDVNQTGLTSLVDVSTLTGLTNLIADRCQLTGSLDLSANDLLVDVNVARQSAPGYNTLTEIDMRNTNNAVTAFNSDFNGSVVCIFVVDDTEPNLATWTLDGNSTLVNDEVACGLLGTDDKALSLFSMYPNPTRNSLNIASKSEASMMNVYSITGKRVLTKTLGYGDNAVNISSLSAGVYLVKFSSDNRSETKKLIIN